MGSRAAGAGIRFIPARAGNTTPPTACGWRCPVHPRSRGEHPPSLPSPTRPTGSSPLARGTPGARRSAPSPGRFIPARAGNTSMVRECTWVSSVHPRSRGEHANRTDVATPNGGSSPLARGTRYLDILESHLRRFIPARAGNTAGRGRRRSDLPVHPRSRGEHIPRPAPISSANGSSPLARGTRRCVLPPGAPGRFIPARAGNTRGPRGSTGRASVHPRSRGEHEIAEAPAARRAGSSPLARGTPILRARARGRGRFIPARAGNARRAAGTPPPAGSSPLARGTHILCELNGYPRRFIPARAGNTPAGHTSTLPLTVHPRSRGEHLADLAGSGGDPGSSPLARGTRMSASVRLFSIRFIPARAGNTSSGAT